MLFSLGKGRGIRTWFMLQGPELGWGFQPAYRQTVPHLPLCPQLLSSQPGLPGSPQRVRRMPFPPAPLWSLQRRALCSDTARNARALPTSLLLSKRLCSCCLRWAQEVWGCLKIAAPRQRHKVHPLSLQNIGLMKDVLFLLWLRMCYLFCNKPPFFCFHLILFHWGFSLFLSFIDFSSPSPYIHSHIFLFFFLSMSVYL